MPPNVFATTGTNVSVLFFDNSKKSEEVILIDASMMGEEYQEGSNKKKRLRDFEIDKIVATFENKEKIDDFSSVVRYDEIKEKGYSLSAGQYFDIEIEYENMTNEEFENYMDTFKNNLKECIEKNKKLDKELNDVLGGLYYE